MTGYSNLTISLLSLTLSLIVWICGMMYWLLRTYANVLRECVLQINNETEYHLARPRQFMHAGTLQHEEEPIPAHFGARVVVHNDRRYLRGFTGICGCLSWDIVAPADHAGGVPACTCARLFVFWNVPGPAGDRNLLGKLYRTVQSVFCALKLASKGPEDKPAAWNVQIFPAATTPLVTLTSLAAKAFPADGEATSRIELSHNHVHLTAHVRPVPRDAKRGNFSLEIRLKSPEAAPVPDPSGKSPWPLTTPSSSPITTKVSPVPAALEPASNLKATPSRAHILHVPDSSNAGASPSELPPTPADVMESVEDFTDPPPPVAASTAVPGGIFPIRNPPDILLRSSSNSSSRSDSSKSDSSSVVGGKGHTSKLSLADLAEECEAEAENALPSTGAPQAAPLVRAAALGSSSESLVGAAQPLPVFSLEGAPALENDLRGTVGQHGPPRSNNVRIATSAPAPPGVSGAAEDQVPADAAPNSVNTPGVSGVAEDQAPANAATQNNPAGAGPSDMEWSRSISLRWPLPDASFRNAISNPGQDTRNPAPPFARDEAPQPGQPPQATNTLSPNGSVTARHLPLLDKGRQRRAQLEAALTQGSSQYSTPHLKPPVDGNRSPGRTAVRLPSGLDAAVASVPVEMVSPHVGMSPTARPSSASESVSVVVSLPTHRSQVHSSDEDTATRDVFWSNA
jgi:hypothetical protein